MKKDRTVAVALITRLRLCSVGKLVKCIYFYLCKPTKQESILYAIDMQRLHINEMKNSWQRVIEDVSFYALIYFTQHASAM